MCSRRAVGPQGQFSVRIRLTLPIGGLGERLNQMNAWLDENCGADGWAITASGLRGVVNDAVAVYFADATIASALVARWCTGSRAPTGYFRYAMIRQHRGALPPFTRRPETILPPRILPESATERAPPGHGSEPASLDRQVA
jgi:hypothetical protein